MGGSLNGPILFASSKESSSKPGCNNLRVQGWLASRVNHDTFAFNQCAR